MAKFQQLLLLTVALNLSRAHVAYVGLPNRLQQVTQGLYINPSADGSSADLYVAATEDNGHKAQWLTDHPVNYLHPSHQAYPVSYTSTITTTSLPHEETVSSQKRAVIASPQVNYAYAIPATADGKPYPYTVQATPTSTTSNQADNTERSDNPAPTAYAYPSTYPLHMYYSQMMAAFANAFNAAKDLHSTNEEGSKTAQAVSSWPSYAYPVQYVMVDPSGWTNAQNSAATTTTTTPAPVTSASDESS